MSYKFNPFTNSLDQVGDNSVTIGNFNNTSTAKGLDVSGTAVSLHAADATNPGAVTTGTQTFAGQKTFNGNVIGSGYVTGTNIEKSVKEYGATGDGSTDDTSAIQSALTALTSGGILRIPSGTYIISAYLVPVNGTHIIGDGPTSIIKRKAGTNINPNSPFRGFIDKQDATNITIENIKFDGLGSWSASTFANPYTPAQNSVGFNNNEIAIQFKKASAGVGCNNIRIVGCEFTGLGHGVYIDGGAQADTQNIFIANNYAHNMGTKAIEIYNVAKCIIVNNNVSGVYGNLTDAGDTSTANSKYADGIYIGASSDVCVSNNEVYDFIRAGIVVQPNGGPSENSTRLAINNNIVHYGHNSKGTEYNTGIYLGDGSITYPNSVSNNVVYDIGTGGNAVGYGIIAEHCIVSGGSISTCVSAGIWPASAYVTVDGVDIQASKYGVIASNYAAGVFLTVKNCTIKDNTVCGVLISHCKGTIDISNNFIVDNGGSTTSKATGGSCSGVAIDRFYNDQKIIINNNTFQSSKDDGSTTGQLYSILGVAGGDVNFSTRYIENNKFLFTGAIASYPSSLHVVPLSFAYDNTSDPVILYEIGNDYGNQNSKLPYGEGEINAAYADGYPRFLGIANAIPVAGAHQVGDYYIKDSWTSIGNQYFVCTATGTPGTWQTWSSITDGTQTISGTKTFSSTITGTTSGNALKSTGDLDLTSFSAANNTSSPTNVTGLAFANGSVRAARILLSVFVSATASLYETFEILIIQKGASWELSASSVGDNSGFTFTITTSGQIQYVNSNYTGFSSAAVRFRASVTSV